MKAYTDLNQSKKLAEILPLESADMRYVPFGDTHPWIWNEEVKLLEKDSVPCWSLAALLDVLNKKAHSLDEDGSVCLSSYKGIEWDCDLINTAYLGASTSSNPVDVCYEIILKLHELKVL